MAGSSKSDAVFANSIADLMTSLAVIFILLFVVYINQSYVQMNKTMKEMEHGAQQVKNTLIKRLSALGIQSHPDPNDPLALVITIRDNDLQFDVNKDLLKDNGKQFLEKFVPVLIKTLSAEFASDVESILIGGFTDSDGEDEANLKLSQARAFAVLRYALDETQINPKEKTFLLDKASVNGRGERELLPRGVKAGSENKQMSRRVEFKIRIKSYEQKNVAPQKP